ncbi:MAG: glycosyltransferase [Magnetococcus sp. MYC-9]
MPDPHMVVVIPCHDEPDLLTTLESLWRCHLPSSPVAVVVVINGAADDPPAVQEHNQQTWQSARTWINDHRHDHRTFHLLFEPQLPTRLAGVGTARKIGMDWALERFADPHKEDGLIVCLDADCQVAPNYLQALHGYAADHPHSPGCSIHFEHPWADLPTHHRQAIVQYELYLRYHVHGLRWSGFPHAFHTVGSSMAVRAAPYRQQGGMNRRKAGEDFYFLQKIIPLGGFRTLNTTTVFPSARASHRVPFGTGRAISDELSGHKDLGQISDPQLFHHLGQLFMRLEPLYHGEWQATLAGLPPPLQDFLNKQLWEARTEEMRANTGSLPAFRKRFFQGFNAFQILKYIHFATEQGCPKQPIAQATADLLTAMGVTLPAVACESLLECYRRLDRQEFWCVGQ